MEPEGSLSRSRSPPPTNPIHAFPFYYFTIHFNIEISCTPRSSKWPFSFWFPYQNSISTLPLPHTCYMLRPLILHNFIIPIIFDKSNNHEPIPVAARSKAWVCDCSLAGIAGSNSAGGMDVCLSLWSVVYCQVEVSASGWSPVQRSPTESGVSECDREASIMRRPWPATGCCAMEKKNREAPHYVFFSRVLLLSPT
jgi:hypothetical protein